MPWFAKLAGSPGVQVIDACAPGEFAGVETFIAGERDRGLDLERSAPGAVAAVSSAIGVAGAASGDVAGAFPP